MSSRTAESKVFGMFADWLMVDRVRLLVIVLIALLFLAAVGLGRGIDHDSVGVISDPQSIALVGGCLDRDPVRLNKWGASSESRFRLSLCRLPDGQTAQALRSDSFVANADGLQFRYYGSRTLPRVALEDEQGNQQLFKFQIVPGHVGYHNLQIPSRMVGATVRLRVDMDAKPGHWIALASLQNGPYVVPVMLGFLQLLAVLLAVAMCLFGLLAAVRSKCSYDESLLIMPVLLGVLGYLAFWGWFIHSWLGGLVCLLAASVAVYGWQQALYRQPALRPQLGVTIAPVVAYSLFVLAIAYFPYPFGVAEDGLRAATRWRNMPVDGYLPKFLAERVWEQAPISPLLSGWLTSDRPPLQSGINLLFYPLIHNGLAYQVVSTVLQVMVLLPLIIVIRKLHLARHLIWILLGLLGSGFMALNSLFVWPKLLSALYLFVCFSVLFLHDSLHLSIRRRLVLAALAGCMAMLCHGGAIFALLPMYLLAMWQGLPTIRRLLVPSGVLMIVSYLPWVFYQRVIDPPGDRLIKWHLAGHPAITEQPFVEVLVNAYASLTLSQWWANQWANIEKIFERAWQIIYWLPEIFKAPFHFPYYEFLHNLSFGAFFFSFWFMSPLYAVLILGLCRVFSDRQSSNVATGTRSRTLILISALGLLIWVLLMFLPSSTGIHHGTYFLWLSWFIVAVLAAVQIHPLYLVIASLMNCLLFTQFYVLDYLWFDRPAPQLYAGVALVTFAALLVSLWCLQRMQAMMQKPNSEACIS